MDMIVRVSRFPNQGETITGTRFDTAHGGKGANQAVAAARLGADVSFIGCVGNDDFGKQNIFSLSSEGINTTYIKTTNTHTGIAVIVVNDTAQNQITVIPGANHQVTPEQVTEALDAAPRVDCVLLQLEIPLPAVICAAELARKNGSLVILNPAPAIPIPEELIALVDYLIPNEHEAYVLTGKKDMTEAGKTLIAHGAKHVIITLGDKGTLLVNGTHQTISPFHVHAVDPTAAGDAFVAAFAVSLLEGKPPKEAIRFANAAGALTATKPGAQPSLPTRKEIEAFLLHKNIDH